MRAFVQVSEQRLRIYILANDLGVWSNDSWRFMCKRMAQTYTKYTQTHANTHTCIKTHTQKCSNTLPAHSHTETHTNTHTNEPGATKPHTYLEPLRPALPAICLSSVSFSSVFAILPLIKEGFVKSVNNTRRMLRLRPMPTASVATSTSYLWAQVPRLTCKLAHAKQKTSQLQCWTKFIVSEVEFEVKSHAHSVSGHYSC